MYEEFGDKAFTWFNLVRALTQNLGERWFADYPMTDASEIRRHIPELEAVRTVAPFADGWRFAKMFFAADLPTDKWCAPSDQGQRIPWTSDPLGRRALSALNELGVTYDFDSPELLAVVLDTPIAPVAALGSVVLKADSSVVLEFGSYVLLSDVDLLGPDPTSVMTQSVCINLPAVMQAAAHLAECPWPSTSWLVQMFDRAEAFGMESTLRSVLPRPYISIAPQQTVVFPTSVPGEPVVVVYQDVPCAVMLGYEVRGEVSDAQLRQSLATVLDVFPKVHTMLVDSVRDGEAQQQAPLQDVLAAGDQLGYHYAPVIQAFFDVMADTYDVGVDVPEAAPTVASRVCTPCGAPASPGGRFCGSCGSAL